MAVAVPDQPQTLDRTHLLSTVWLEEHHIPGAVVVRHSTMKAEVGVDHLMEIQLMVLQIVQVFAI